MPIEEYAREPPATILLIDRIKADRVFHGISAAKATPQ